MKHRNLLEALYLVFFLIAPGVLFAQNPNCTIIVPDAPLTAAGLATPYQLTATKASDGECHETNTNSSAFVQAAILDPATGQISIYNPLVIDQNSMPAGGAAPVPPTLPDNAIVALWFGFNGNNLVQQAATPGTLEANGCVNGLPDNVFGQFSYCNAPAFFKAANRAIRRGQLRVPHLGMANDGGRCPSVRDFFVVDQDQSDNLPVTYLVSPGGLLAQNTAANVRAVPGATVLGNPSDNGLVDRFLDPDLNCTPWKVADLADPGKLVPGLALNELQARAHQRSPAALIPAGDPMVLDGDGSVDLAKVNAYRRGVDQPEVHYNWQAETARYCRQMLRIAPARLLLDQALLLSKPSPVADDANSMFTFLAQRFAASYDTLGCADLVNIPDPVSFTQDKNGVAISAKIDRRVYDRCWRRLAPLESQDVAADDAAKAEAATQ
ncbi:MAG: hypothetical protein WB755_12620 [Terriglobales bacterium]|jgi:hypothetical protein